MEMVGGGGTNGQFRAMAESYGTKCTTECVFLGKTCAMSNKGILSFTFSYHMKFFSKILELIAQNKMQGFDANHPLKGLNNENKRNFYKKLDVQENN